ncbi:MAG TPA: AraD1 family protein [Steroidobacteraceae bacterium]|jgi:hypothetical protein|nr:AraD1 family protein [Steroidobacteraceae bacterium]
MSLRLVQIELGVGARCVAAIDSGHQGGGGIPAIRLDGVTSLHQLASAALAEGRSLQDAALARRTAEVLDIRDDAAGIRLLPPIDHPDPAHLYLTGTGLTHLGSAESRDKMHALAAAGGTQTDSMRMFLDGLKGGKPAGGGIGSQPEWFYKGDGSSVVGTGAALEMPAFSQDGGEEPEIAGIYLIDSNGEPRRLGFCLANEFSDHVTERENYLWLAHSKLRPAALGPELLTGPLPADVRGTSRIFRGERVIWEKPFFTGEANMSHYIANLEHHHFKYGSFRRPGDVHVHFFGTATLSFADQVRVEPGDVFDIRADAFVLPLRNPLARASSRSFAVRPL